MNRHNLRARALLDTPCASVALLLKTLEDSPDIARLLRERYRVCEAARLARSAAKTAKGGLPTILATGTPADIVRQVADRIGSLELALAAQLVDHLADQRRRWRQPIPHLLKRLASTWPALAPAVAAALDHFATLQRELARQTKESPQRGKPRGLHGAGDQPTQPAT